MTAAVPMRVAGDFFREPKVRLGSSPRLKTMAEGKRMAMASASVPLVRKMPAWPATGTSRPGPHCTTVVPWERT